MGLLTEVEKAFDRVHWGFPRATLQHIGIGGTLVGRIMVLYSDPSAQIRLNGHLISVPALFQTRSSNSSIW